MTSAGAWEDVYKRQAEYLREANGYWQGLGSKERLAQKVGDRSYTCLLYTSRCV